LEVSVKSSEIMELWLASMTQKQQHCSSWQNEEVNAEMDEVCQCWEQSGNSGNGFGDVGMTRQR